ncbi:MAG: response regulator [Ardenticatenaceae bacterium]|nr:response regulator [Ardenticatenaceae bacterium]MCB9442779.1 response regulator [Ardenticatenaceae bacterium]
MTKFMIVDDDAENLYALRVLLEENGFVVETAENGQEALDKARANPPNMIISDVLMPVMDGFNLCRYWMQDEQLQTIPFVFYTATYTDYKDQEFALNLGASRFIVKPTEPVELVAIIEAVFAEWGDGRFTIPSHAIEEPVFIKEYNERLIKKLEHKALQLEKANQRLKVLYQTSTDLAVVQPMDRLVSHMLQTVTEAMGYPTANFFIFDAEDQQFSLIAATGYTNERFEELQRLLVFRLGEERGLVGLVGQTRQSLVQSETHSDPRWITIDPTLHSALYVPVIYEDRLWGVIGLFSKEPNAFTANNVRHMETLANNVAIALENAKLYEAQQRYTEKLEALVAARTAELQAALEQAQAADRLKSQFVSDMNHELRSPISVVQLYLGLLSHGKSENWERYVATIKREADRLQKMIEELLDLSRMDLGKVAANLEPIDLNFLIGNLILDRAELISAKKLTLDFESDRDIPLALADRQLLFQVLTNLLANAINYTSSGGITLCTGTAVADNQTWVTASVIDTGPGISDEDKEHLFERFYRGEVGKESGAPGSGLGLAICKEIINRHGGRISVESTAGSGSIFKIWLQPATTTAE